MLMALDMFAFEIGSLPYEELSRRFGWRHASSDRFRARAAFQFIGPGEDTIELSGALYPGDGIGAYSAVETIRGMANTGDAYTLVSGVGEVLGDFIIHSLDITQSLFFLDGAPRRADFRLSLERVDG
jgi:uncharacterized protein